jgi:hypothetical protein
MRARVSRFAGFVLLVACVLVGALAASCNSEGPPRGPEAICAKACETRDPACKTEECWRGCNFILDRLAEHEGDPILACVARETASSTNAGTGKACSDRIWARCAVRVGVHADGGPPAPPPPKDFEDEGDDQL